MLASKGFKEAVVSLTSDGADVVVSAAELSEANRAQIEDIVTRKTGVAAENIVINPVAATENQIKKRVGKAMRKTRKSLKIRRVMFRDFLTYF